MKNFKKSVGFTLAALGAAVLLAVGGQKAQAATTLTVGASPVPHAQILEHVKPQLKKEGINLVVKKFTDYVMPNRALTAKELDANYFQHVPFLNDYNKKNNTDIVSAGTVHIEPIGIYSKQVKKLSQVKTGSTVLVSNNKPDYGRILTILKDAKLITLKKGVKITSATFNDIAKNPKKLKFKYSYEPKLMPELLKNNEGTLIAINANYAVGADLNPTKDAIALEKSSSPYANIIAVRKGDQNKPAIKKLMKALTSKSTQNWIKEKYNGAVLPVK
ncbi:amino acid ABC transporter substrate-binding protein [Agrilactobacillus composti DSM 18527 = JCM 14202]|uniref:Lipoprotein n=1 Tax=Agrilactobacillus composti DSM 18527 = JCM 14202 TaxID=1423734 RepID=X0PFL7_9LACO|nr:MetQ/NlpA family ABC transporter substrate-binding protein [Agrilactobacillus composti]KRM36692.1 amino acid ABC transporter substrate-binding protein [Agrilactobacillus composti DSM 18527 = JCM 14202]GAF40548.1 methionine ABC transporter substrate-binding protein [Agrilactobacillus composti DSM 18527 = JCM 14202]